MERKSGRSVGRWLRVRGEGGSLEVIRSILNLQATTPVSQHIVLVASLNVL